MYYYIYKITNITLKISYIGSTASPPNYRFKQHQSPHNKCRSRLLFTNPDDIIEFEVLLEHLTEDRELIYQIERLFIEKNNCVNKNIPTRTRAEYKEFYGDIYIQKCKEYNKKYRLENKEKIKIQQKQYLSEHLDDIKKYQKKYQQKYRMMKKLN